ncbi:MAG: (Fe-S)-binding protein [Candidatus Nezhaarchaeota archaeon]|nr:(Fe-S)-binding protein [Candidatus Nezhaarchaeota archaeon]MCX8142430.1 (Fe-S)-binding protein [Candidatus Nezhaarchaeota archaeon]MDW8050597.1 (Fe-S)-binding protein [Nitrososphaerota archaeon]
MSSELLETLKGLNFNLCIQCGTCSASCPVLMNARSPLNVRLLMIKVAYFFRKVPRVDLKQHNEVWDCTTCSNCSVRCPRNAGPLDVILGIRSILLEEGLVPKNIGKMLEAVYKYGNAWGVMGDRASWARDLNVRIAPEKVDGGMLYFVGCASSYDDRAKNIARAIAKVLNSLGERFFILGREEKCCGNEAYSAGERGLFEELVNMNLETFERYNVEKIITGCPHGFNIFKKKYGKVSFEPIHYTTYLANLIDSGKLKFSKRMEKIITYHDSCYLGKHNSIYDEPRKILESMPGVKFVEMSRSRKMSICCEGGGGRMWHDIGGSRLSELRVRDALESGAEIIATACPFCLATIEDSIKTLGLEDKLVAKDIMEIVLECGPYLG